MTEREREAYLRHAYQLFNHRDVNALLAMMTDDIEWPNVADNTVLHGKRRHPQLQGRSVPPPIRTPPSLARPRSRPRRSRRCTWTRLSARRLNVVRQRVEPLAVASSVEARTSSSTRETAALAAPRGPSMAPFT